MSDPDFTDAIARFRQIQEQPGFVAFSRVLGFRIESGRELDAFLMLASMGAEGELAHKILDGWPRDSKPDPRLAILGLDTSTAAVLRLSFFIDNLDAYDWSALLTTAVNSAEDAKG